MKRSYWATMNLVPPKVLFIVAVIIGLLYNSLAIAPPTNAKIFAEMSPDEKARSYVYYYGVLNCVNGANSISNKDVISGGFKGPRDNTINSWYTARDDGKRECQTIIPDAVKLWGYSDLSAALKDWKYDEPTNAGGDWTNNNPGTDAGAAIRTKVYGGQTPVLTGEVAYLYWKTTLRQNCRLSNPVELSKASAALKNEVSGGNSKEYIKVIEPKKPYDGSSTTENIYKVGNFKTVVPLGPVNSPLSGSGDCNQIAAKITKAMAVAYARYGKEKPQEAGSQDGGAAASNEDAKSTCAIEGVGWFVCPAMTFLAGVADSSFKILSTWFLEIDREYISDTSGTHVAWETMRNIANVLFVFFFLFIIYSQITGIGISNYGIKRVLPRIIIAALLVNLSFLVCQLAVDIGNVLGYSIYNFMLDIAGGIYKSSSGAPVDQMQFLPSVGVLIVAGLALYALVALGSLAVLGAVIVFLLMILLLVVRKVLIILFIVISPIAIVCMLLPNTEDFFKKWRTTFVRLIMIFPIVSFFFGAGFLVRAIISVADQNAIDVNQLEVESPTPATTNQTPGN